MVKYMTGKFNLDTEDTLPPNLETLPKCYDNHTDIAIL